MDYPIAGYVKYLANVATLILGVALWLIPQSALALTNGDQIIVASSNGVKVRQSAGGAQQGSQINGATGKIISNSQTAPIAGSGSSTTYTWWNVDFNSGQDGWVAGDGGAISVVSASSGTIRLTVNSSSGSALQSADMNAVLLFDNSRNVIANRQSPTSNPTDFTNVSYGNRFFLVYCWDMLAAESGSFDHASSITPRTATAKARRPLKITVYRSDEVSPLADATVLLDSYNGQSGAWTLRASGTTNSTGTWTQSAWPTTDIASGEKYRVRIEFGGVAVGSMSPVTLSNTSEGSSFSVTTNVVNRGTIRLTVKSSSGANLIPSEMNGVILFNDSRGEISRREPPTVNPMDFTSVSYGSRYFLVYCWDMLAGKSDSFNHAASITPIPVTTHSKQPLSVTAYRSDGFTPLVGATVRLDSYNGQTTAWTLRASGSTDAAGKWSVDAWPTFDLGEKYRVRVEFGGVEVGADSSVRLASSTIGSTATVTTSVAGLAPLSVSLENINGSPAPSATTRMVLYSNPSQTKQGNPANFDPVTTGSYTVEAYNGGTIWGEELWRSEQITVSANQTNVRTLRRNLPYASGVSLKNRDTDQDVVLGSASNVSAGQLIKFRIPIKNDIINTNHNVKVRLILDRDRTAPYDYDFLIPAKAISGGATLDFEHEEILKGNLTGTFYHSLEVSTQAQTNFVRTDSWGWTPAFTVSKSSQISGRVSISGPVGGEFPIKIQRYGFGDISTTAKTWLIIHGRTGKAGDLWISGPGGLADTLVSYPGQQDYQILLLDWQEAAYANNFPFVSTHEEDRISPVAHWAAKRLENYGIQGSSLNIIGHSWGGNLAAELAERMSGGVDTIVALDAATNGLGSYNPHDSVNFSQFSQFSWAFQSSIFGSPITPITADEALIVDTGLAALDAHCAVIDLFIWMLKNGDGGVSSQFRLSRLLAHEELKFWMRDLFTTTIVPNGFPSQSGYEGLLKTQVGGTIPESLTYYVSPNQKNFINESVDVIYPLIDIISPSNNPTHSVISNTLSLNGTTSDNVGVTHVSWSNDRGGSGTAVGTSNWTISGITLLGGQNILTVTARDAAGNTHTDTLTVTYTPADAIRPAIAITSPTSSSTHSTTTANSNLGGVASDNIGVTQVTWSNDRGGSGTATGTINWTVAGIALSSGQNLLTVTARDAAGNTQTAILTVNYNPADTVLPVVAITSPTALSSHSNSTGSLSIAGTATDNVGVTQVTWSNDRGGSGTATGTINWTVAGIALSSGQNLLTVTARGAAGNTQTAILTVTYHPADIVLPLVAITSPTTSSTHTTSTGSLSIGGTASDNVGVTQVIWSNDRGGSGTATGTINWTVAGIALSSGQNILTVIARDAAGNTQTDTLTVTYNAADTTKPVVAITAPVNASTYATTKSSLDLGGTASDAGGITQVTWNNDRGGSGTATGTTNWSVPRMTLSAGQNILTISGWDTNSNIGTATLTVTYTTPGEQPWEGTVAPLMVDLPGGRYFGISFNRLVGSTGSGIRIEGSSNLSDWVDATPSMLMHGAPVASVDGLRESVTFRCPLPISDVRAPGLRFLRLAIVDSRVPVVGTVNPVIGTMGGAVTLNITTSGDLPTRYDWYRDWILVGKTTVPQFQIPSLSTSAIGTYRVVAHNAYGSATSNPFMVQAGGWTYDSWLTAMVGNGKTPTSPGYARSDSLLEDGHQNLTKYAFGSTPSGSLESKLPHTKMLSNGGTMFLGIEFERLLTPKDVGMRIEASGDLVSWRDVTASMVPANAPVASSDGLSERVTFQCPVSLAQAESQNWRYLRVAVTDLSSPTVLLSDDFNDSSIDTTRWTASGNTVQEQDGYLKLLTNQTDAGGKVLSRSFLMPTNGLTITRKARVHFASAYSIPSIRLHYRDGANQEVTLFSILYGNMSYDDGIQHSVYGTFLGLGVGNPHNDDLRQFTVEGPAVIWDAWFDEKITYDRQTGLVRYFRNGVLEMSGTAPGCTAGTSVFLQMDGWGWFTGHWQHCDDLIITSGTGS